MPHRWLHLFERWSTEQPIHPAPARPPIQPPTPTPQTPPPLLSGIPLVVRKNPRARRYILRVSQDGTVCVTVPRGGTEAFARRFAYEKEAWIREQLTRFTHTRAPEHAWGPGALVWFRGERHPLLDHGSHAQIADFTFPIPPLDSDWRPSVERHFRVLATTELPPLVLGRAALHDLVVQRIQVRNQRSRWGSCSRQGTISLNWRLVQTPLFVRDYLIAHELAHLRQMNHSQRFWAVVEQFYPDWRTAERWLRENGRRLLT